MITLERLQEVVDGKNSYFEKIEGNNITIYVQKYPALTYFDITVTKKYNSNKIMEVYRRIGIFDTYDLVRELLSPLNDK